MTLIKTLICKGGYMWEFLGSLGAGNWAIIFATLMGPILAVRAQKYIEEIRSHRAGKIYVFTTLMSTRATNISIEHVRALNSIDFAFHGKKVFGLYHHRTRKEQCVLDAWKEYLDHLAPPAEGKIQPLNWNDTRIELMTNLLAFMANDLGFYFDRVHLKRAIYSPQAHTDLESDLLTIRKDVIRLLSGELPLSVRIDDVESELQ
ncbi:DUF6680 family protein [Methylobacillus pratensis]